MTPKQSNGTSTSAQDGALTTAALPQDKHSQQHQEQEQNAPGMARLAICTAGICVCYLYYGLLQERFFTSKQPHERLGATFVLVTQCVTNTLVAVLWQQVERKLLLPPVAPPGAGVATSSASSSLLSLPLHHTLLLFTSGCYVTAMTCSNEAIQYVSYPVAVLAKSCKLIPTMFVGQTVEGKRYSTQEWLAALAISTGILLFQWEQHKLHSKHTNSSTPSGASTDDDDDDRATYGMFLLLISLVMDGVLSSCQNFLKRPPTQAATIQSKSDSNGNATAAASATPASNPYRPPNAVETMLYVNLYALLFLIPQCLYTGQWQHGVDALWSSALNDMTMVHKILVLNATVAAGQVFIFLTITWYTPVITTTITTTRKFVTILLSVWAFGHSFTAIQWTAVTLVFTGLYLVIMVQTRAKRTTSSSRAGTSRKAKTE
jgi:UDP-galactose transporter B1